VLTIVRYESARALDALAEEWDSFLRETSAHGFFLGWRWVRAWCAATKERYRPFVVVARDEANRLVGIAPLAVERASASLQLLGQSYWGQFVEFALAPDCEDAAMHALCADVVAARGANWRDASFRFVGLDSPFERRLVDVSNGLGVALCEIAVDAAPYAILPADVDAYFRGQGGHFAKWARRFERRLAREGTVEFRVCDDAASVDEAFATLADMYEKRWEAPLEPEFARFLQGLARELVPRREMLLAGLYVDGVAVGASLDWVYENRILGNVWGWDPAWAAFSIGNVLIAHTVRTGIERGYAAYDMLSGDAGYKRRWGNALRAVVELASVAGPVPGAVPATASESALGSLDEVRFTYASEPAEPDGAGFAAAAGLRVVLRGWGVPADPGAAGWYAAAHVGGRRFGVRYGGERPDVVAALGNDAFARCGFDGIVPLGDLPPGEYVLRIAIGDRTTHVEWLVTGESVFRIAEP
jgi:CelD/BcsL family acetyltransferase involved in cellulose biosynthesis